MLFLSISMMGLERKRKKVDGVCDGEAKEAQWKEKRGSEMKMEGK